MRKTEYYVLVKKSDKTHSGQLVTASIRSCCLCGDMIDGMGGPGWGSICVPCGDDIIEGKLTYNREKKDE